MVRLADSDVKILKFLSSRKCLPFTTIFRHFQSLPRGETLSDVTIGRSLRRLEANGLVRHDSANEPLADHNQRNKKGEIRKYRTVSRGCYTATPVSGTELLLGEVAEFIRSPQKHRVDSWPNPSVLVSESQHVGDLFDLESESLPTSSRGLSTDLWGVYEHVIGVWIRYQHERYSKRGLHSIRRYEEALSRMCEIARISFTPTLPKKGAAPDEVAFAEPVFGSLLKLLIEGEKKSSYLGELLRQIEDKMRATETNNLVGDTETNQLREIIFDNERKRAYELYLTELIPPKTVLVVPISGFDSMLSRAISFADQVGGERKKGPSLMKTIVRLTREDRERRERLAVNFNRVFQQKKVRNNALKIVGKMLRKQSVKNGSQDAPPEPLAGHLTRRPQTS